MNSLLGGRRKPIRRKRAVNKVTSGPSRTGTRGIMCVGGEDGCPDNYNAGSICEQFWCCPDVEIHANLGDDNCVNENNEGFCNSECDQTCIQECQLHGIGTECAYFNGTYYGFCEPPAGYYDDMGDINWPDNFNYDEFLADQWDWHVGCYDCAQHLHFGYCWDSMSDGSGCDWDASTTSCYCSDWDPDGTCCLIENSSQRRGLGGRGKKGSGMGSRPLRAQPIGGSGNGRDPCPPGYGDEIPCPSGIGTCCDTAPAGTIYSCANCGDQVDLFSDADWNIPEGVCAVTGPNNSPCLWCMSGCCDPVTAYLGGYWINDDINYCDELGNCNTEVWQVYNCYHICMYAQQFSADASFNNCTWCIDTNGADCSCAEYFTLECGYPYPPCTNENWSCQNSSGCNYMESTSETWDYWVLDTLLNCSTIFSDGTDGNPYQGGGYFSRRVICNDGTIYVLFDAGIGGPNAGNQTWPSGNGVSGDSMCGSEEEDLGLPLLGGNLTKPGYVKPIKPGPDGG